MCIELRNEPEFGGVVLRDCLLAAASVQSCKVRNFSHRMSNAGDLLHADFIQVQQLREHRLGEHDRDYGDRRRDNAVNYQLNLINNFFSCIIYNL